MIWDITNSFESYTSLMLKSEVGELTIISDV